jgi:twitching motility protein PilT
MATDAKQSQESESAVEKRQTPRTETHLEAEVSGRHGTYRALIHELSKTGALMTVVDSAFDLGPDPSDYGLVGMRVAFHFDEGMQLRIPERDVQINCDVVRISEREPGEEGGITLGCSFKRPLTRREMTMLGLEADLPEFEQVAGRLPHVQLSRAGIHALLTTVVEHGASDLHIQGGSPVRIRVDGKLMPLDEEPLPLDEAEDLVRALLTEDQFERFDACGDLDIGYSLPGQARFRVNVLRARGAYGMAVRRIPEDVPTIEQLGLSPLCAQLSELPRGLVLVTGPTGSGKSTTLAAMVQHINDTRACHIVTMEDPIEYIHREVHAHITQREVGRDTQDFASALKRALRQDPDVLLVGEMRDLETIRMAVTAAETGHLVFATLHTPSAPLSISRIVDVFPPEQQRQIRMQVADSLQAVMSQMLLPRLGGGVALAQEILVATAPVRALIREGKIPQIANVIQTGAQEGMQVLEDVLNDLVARGQISYDTAIGKANYPRLIDRAGKRMRSGGPTLRSAE